MEPSLNRPWLIAAWPGMGAVAHIAASYLVQKLDAQPFDEIPSDETFDTPSVQVKSGLIQPTEVPRNRLFGWKHPRGGPDLLVFLGDRQPQQRGLQFCREVLRRAQVFGATRAFTFAAMGTPIHPETQPRVFAASSSRELLNAAIAQGATPLEEGEISGLNGVFLAAATAFHIEGLCLLGEFPFFASAVPNPKASSAVLEVFRKLSGIPLDLEELDAQARVVESSLVEHLARVQDMAEALNKEVGEGVFETDEEVEETPPETPPPEKKIPGRVLDRIERLFEEARKDREKALDLKRLLDRHDLFKRYEDRFLDLFKRGG